MIPYFIHQKNSIAYKIDKNGKIVSNNAPLNKKSIQLYTQLIQSRMSLRRNDLGAKLETFGFGIDISDGDEMSLRNKHNRFAQAL